MSKIRKTTNTNSISIEVDKILNENSTNSKQAEKQKIDTIKAIPLQIMDIIPVSKYTELSQGYNLKDREYVNYFKIESFDYMTSSDNDIELHIAYWQRFYNTCANPIKLIAINMPLNVTENIQFVLSKYRKCTNDLYREQLKLYLREFSEELKTRETKDFYLAVYAESEEDLIKISMFVETELINIGLCRYMSNNEKEKLLAKFSNPYNLNSTMISGE